MNRRSLLKSLILLPFIPRTWPPEECFVRLVFESVRAGHLDYVIPQEHLILEDDGLYGPRTITFRAVKEGPITRFELHNALPGKVFNLHAAGCPLYANGGDVTLGWLFQDGTHYPLVKI